VAEELARAAANAGIQITPGPRFGVDGAFERFVRIPFTLPRADVEAAVVGLSRAWETFEQGGRRVG
jgi:DNA-binding transcriptional MocR family regulator